jgi:circadian clock protein KaiC
VLLVLDGLSAVEAKAGSGFEMKRFTHELQVLARATDCTMLLLTTSSGAQSSPEQTLVDGVIELRQRIYALRSERRLLVHKTRGSGYLEGEHAFRISRDGITVFRHRVRPNPDCCLAATNPRTACASKRR